MHSSGFTMTTASIPLLVFPKTWQQLLLLLGEKAGMREDNKPLCQFSAKLLIQYILHREGADDFAGAFEEPADLRHRVARVIK